MTQITIPAAAIQIGDIIDIGGVQRTIKYVIDAEKCSVAGHVIAYTHTPTTALYFRVDEMITVERPDPDAEVVEVMAEAIGDYYIVGGWNSRSVSEEDRQGYREAASLALVAYLKYQEEKS